MAYFVLLALACSRGSAVPDEENEGGGRTATAGSSGSSQGGTAGSALAGSTSAGGGSSNGGQVTGLPRLDNDTSTGVFVHLFEWRWQDVATECEQFLGPKGFTAVQISPPSEHALLPNYGSWAKAGEA